MIEIFLKIHHTQNVVQELLADPFLKNQIHLWINSLIFYTVCFFVSQSRGLPKYIDTKLVTTGFDLILSSFKNEKALQLISLLHLLDNFWRKIFLAPFYINWPNLIGWENKVKTLSPSKYILCVLQYLKYSTRLYQPA